MWPKVTAVLHLSAQKTSPNLVCWCVFAFICHPTFPLLLVSRRSNIPRLVADQTFLGELQIKHSHFSSLLHLHSSVSYLYAPIRSAPVVHGFYLCALIWSTHFILVHFSVQYIQCIGLCVPWTLVEGRVQTCYVNTRDTSVYTANLSPTLHERQQLDMWSLTEGIIYMGLYATCPMT